VARSRGTLDGLNPAESGARRFLRTLSRHAAQDPAGAPRTTEGPAAERRYVVIGAGAVGATVAAQLAEAGQAVVVVARGANLAALRARGLRYVRPDGERRVPLHAVGGPYDLDLRAGDVLVVAAKAQDAEALFAEWAWRPVGDTTAGPGAVAGQPAAAAEALPVVLLQNGLDTARSALRRFRAVVDAAVVMPASYLRPGEVVSRGMPQVGGVVLGRAPGGGGSGSTHPADLTADQVAADLGRAGFASTVVDDIARYKAGKLLGNLAYNLDAVAAPGPLRDAVAAAAVEEAQAVFTAAGVEAIEPRLAAGLEMEGWRIADVAGHGPAGSSTWQSLARGGTVESDFINGEIVLLARLHGAPAPVNEALARCLGTAAVAGSAPAGLGEAELAGILAVAGRPRPATLSRQRVWRS
jgi:thiosulfate/3-mercaptopyruvate sulfurtransferase